MKFKSLDDVKRTYGEENLICIVNIRQILQYAKLSVQPKWIAEGHGGKLIAYYFIPETRLAWQYWLENNPKTQPS